MSITPRDPADFTPTRGDYTELKPFRFWCQKVLPLVYDNSLSYYELLCKVVDYLNKTMEDVETLDGDVTALYTAYDELQTYVNEYFSSLDVQAEIDNKLDEMVTSGQLVEILQPTIASEVSDWLAEHITPTTPAVDDTLTIEGAAADARVTGLKINASMNPKGIYSGDLDELFTTGIYYLTSSVLHAPVVPTNKAVITYYGLFNTGRFVLQIFIDDLYHIYTRTIDTAYGTKTEWIRTNEAGDSILRDFIYNDFYVGENLYNHAAANIGKKLKTDGTLEDDSSFITTDYFPVIGNFNIIVSGFYGTNRTTRNANAVAFYDYNKNFLSYTDQNTAIPYNAYYARVQFNSAYMDFANGNYNVMVEVKKGTGYSEYKPFGFFELKEEYTNNSRLDNSVYEKDSFINAYNPAYSVYQKIYNNRKLRITRSVGTAQNDGYIFACVKRDNIENKKIIITVEASRDVNLNALYLASRYHSWGGGRIQVARNYSLAKGLNIFTVDCSTANLDTTEASTYKYLSILLDETCTEEYTLDVGYSIIEPSQLNYSNIIAGRSAEQVLADIYKLTGKTWNACGDSITAQGLYVNYVAKHTGATVTNVGLSSSTIAINNTHLTNQSIVERILGLNGNTSPSNANVWTVQGGLNDVLYSSVLGALSTSGNYDNTTVYGALQSICEYILNSGDVKVFLFTPHHTSMDGSTGSTGITIADVRTAILDVGTYYGIPVIDLWKESQINAYNLTAHNSTTSDGVHPNSRGARYMGSVIAGYISLYCS